MKTNLELERIQSFLLETIDRYGYEGALIGISGGIDSAVAGALLVRALGRERVFGLLLPERDSARSTPRDAEKVCDHLGIRRKTVWITPMLRKLGVYALVPPAFWAPDSVKIRFARNKWKRGAPEGYISDLKAPASPEFRRDRAYYRSKHRIRMCQLYFHAEQMGYAVVGTTNRTEKAVGYYVKWGDDSTDIEPLLHLYKTEVRELGRALGLPAWVLDKPPSPDIARGITDEYSLGMSYADLDRVLMAMEEGRTPDGVPSDLPERVRQIVHQADFRDSRNIHLDRLG